MTSLHLSSYIQTVTIHVKRVELWWNGCDDVSEQWIICHGQFCPLYKAYQSLWLTYPVTSHSNWRIQVTVVAQVQNSMRGPTFLHSVFFYSQGGFNWPSKDWHIGLSRKSQGSHRSYEWDEYDTSLAIYPQSMYGIHRFINLDRIINSKTADNHVEAMESAVLYESLTQLNTSRQVFKAVCILEGG